MTKQSDEKITTITVQVEITVYGEVTEEQVNTIRDSVVSFSPELINQIVSDTVEDFSISVA